MKCHACTATLPDDASFCSSCGTDLSARTPADIETVGLDVALASANLLRLRSRWIEAEARCIEVLRIDPNHVHAHSLLGDIYADQGRRDDAAQWYQLALDLNPRSRPDREKLARLRSVAASGDAGAAAARSARRERVLGVHPLAWVRWLAAVLAVFLLGAVVAVVMSRSRGPDAAGKRETIGRSGPRHAPGSPGPSLLSGPGGDVATQAVPPPANDGLAPPEPGEEDRSPNIAEREASIESAIASTAGMTPATHVGAVSIHAGGGAALVLLERHETDAQSAQAGQDTIAPDVLRAAQALFKAETGIAIADIVVRVSSPEMPAHTVLRARVLRRPALDFSGAASAQEAFGAFSSWWWSPAWSAQNPRGSWSP